MNHGEIVAMGTTTEIESRYGAGRKMIVKAGSDLLKYLMENTKLEVSSTGEGEVSIVLRGKEDALVAPGAIQESGRTGPT